MKFDKLLLGLLVVFICSTAYAETVKGRVSGANATTVNIVLEENVKVAKGDPVEILFKIPGVDEEASAGKGEVTEVLGSMVVARLAPGAGKIHPGFQARIETKASATPATTQPASTETLVIPTASTASLPGIPVVPPESQTGPVWFGINSADLTKDHLQKAGLQQNSAVAVVVVYPGSAAAAAGLISGDLLLRVDDQEITSGNRLAEILKQKGAGQIVSLDLFRYKKGPLNVNVQTESEPAAEEKLARVRSEAERGNPLFEYFLAAAYLQGYGGVQQNKAEALRWLTLAAEHGNADARAEIARLHFFDPSAGVNNPQAENWLREAAQQGNSKAQYLLGLLYLQGRTGGAVDNAQAFLWFRRSAEAGHPEGITSVGAMYENGLSVPKDIEKAVEWYKKAAALGEPTAQQNLKRLSR